MYNETELIILDSDDLIIDVILIKTLQGSIIGQSPNKNYISLATSDLNQWEETITNYYNLSK